VVSFVDGHASPVKMFWDEAGAKGEHLESWQYDPVGGKNAVKKEAYVTN